MPFSSVIYAIVMNIGHEIKKARKALGLSQAAYGARVGAMQSQVCKWELGRGISLKSAVALIRRGGLEWTAKGPRAVKP